MTETAAENKQHREQNQRGGESSAWDRNIPASSGVRIFNEGDAILTEW
jgi:hypothetical protein